MLKNITDENLPPSINKPKLLDQLRAIIRTKHYSLRTEEAYIQWIKRFIIFHNKRHPNEMSEVEINQFVLVHRRAAEDAEGMFFYLAGRRQPGKNTSLRQSN